MAKRPTKKKTIAVFSGDKGETAGNGEAKKPGAGKGKKYCPHCAKIIGAAKTVCPECGKNIPPKNPKKAPAQKKHRESATNKGASFPFGANVKSNGAADPFNAAASLLEAAGGLTEAKAVLDRLAAIAKLC